jgi:hypothetical protein
MRCSIAEPAMDKPVCSEDGQANQIGADVPAWCALIVRPPLDGA